MNLINQYVDGEISLEQLKNVGNKYLIHRRIVIDVVADTDLSSITTFYDDNTLETFST